MRRARSLILALALSAAAVPALADQTIIVLDASGSMWGQIDGKAKMEIARERLDDVLRSVPAANELGLMVYGHREKGSCGDIELAVPPAPGSARSISDFVRGVNPKGKTPLSASVRMAAEEMRFTEDKATVILVTDGIETCEADPCALANELEKAGIDFTAHVVGFGLSEEEGRQVACLAENTGGRYLQAKDAAELATALAETVAAAPEPPPAPVAEPVEPEFNVVTDAVLHAGGPSLGDDVRIRWDFYKPDDAGEAAGDPVEGGYGAVKSFNLPPGRHVAVARLAALRAEVVFEATADAVARPKVDFNAAELVVIPKRTADGEADGEARIDAEFAGGRDGGYGRTEMMVTAGTVAIRGRIGPSEVSETIEVAAGEKRVHELVIGSGLLIAKALYAQGGPAVEGGDIRFDVVAVKPAIDGSRKPLNGGYGVDIALDLPVGDFVLTARLGEARGEAPVSIRAGERSEATVVLDAGVLAVAAPGAYRIDILGRKDIQGKARDVSGGYGETFQETLPAGGYTVRVTYEGDRAAQERPVTVAAGERSEVTVD